MTTYSNDTVEIQRIKKTKVLGEYRDMFIKHLELKSFSVNRNNGVVSYFFPGRTDIKQGDRCVNQDGIFDVKFVKIAGKHNGVETKIKCMRNEFESGMKRLKEMGCSVQEGILAPIVKDPAAEAFMDSWVGTYILNIVEHYDEIKNGRDISVFHGMFNRDVPVVCVGAGPSLDKNAHLLYDFPGVIIATDRSYKMLRARGIAPDLTMSVDCHYDLIAEMLECPDSNKHKLILNTCSDPKASKVWGGDIFWFLMRHPGVQFMDKILPALFPKFHSLPNLGNVGNSSVFFADYVGLSPIVLIGHDYGYTDGKMSAKRFDISEDGNVTELEDNHDALMEKRSGKVKADDVVTYAPFLSYRDSIYDLRKKKGIDIINCTEGGILNKLPSMSFAKMIEILTPKYGKKYLEAKEKIAQI